MSKKKFKAGLESLFGEPAVAGMSPFLVEEKQELDAKEKTVRVIKKRSSSKNFTSDLETLFSGALDQEYTEQKNVIKKDNNKIIAKRRSDKPVVGLDTLIRKTTTTNYDKREATSPLKKRLTITMERKKLERLKNVAKKKKAYLKDIIDELVSDYLEQVKDDSFN